MVAKTRGLIRVDNISSNIYTLSYILIVLHIAGSAIIILQPIKRHPREVKIMGGRCIKVRISIGLSKLCKNFDSPSFLGSTTGFDYRDLFIN